MEQTRVLSPTPLEVGRRIYYPGDASNPGGQGVVVAVHGVPHGEESFDLLHGIHCVFDAVLTDGRRFQHVPEERFYGMRPWRFLDKVHGPALIDALQRNAAARVVEQQCREADRKQRLADAVAALIAANPHLTPLARYRGNAAVAKNVRSALKVAGFNGVSVRTSRGSMTSSIRVELPAGTTDERRDEAARIAKRFELGRFDGMTDSYEYDRDNAWAEAFGGVRYVFVNRSRT